MYPQINRDTHRYHSSLNDTYGRIIGEYKGQHIEHTTSIHLVLDIWVTDGIYTADVNIHSNDGSDVEFCIMDEKKSTPVSCTNGIDTQVHLRYSDLGLKQSDFKTATPGELYSYLSHLATQCNKIIVYGFIYHDTNLNGIHDIHMNTSDTQWTKYPSRSDDGVIGFYFDCDHPHVQWVYIKFKTQYLPN